jgi:hypothetical protein
MNKCKICKSDISDKRVYCSNMCKFSDSEYNKRRVSKSKNNLEVNLKCKLCGYTSADELNKSGNCTKHLKIAHSIIDSNYLKYFDKFGIEIKHKEKWKCPACDWSTVDLQNKSGCITRHVRNKHHLTPLEFDIKFDSKIPAAYIDNSNKNLIECKICGERMFVISNTHCLNKHGMTQRQYKKLYGECIVSPEMSAILKKCGGDKGTYKSKGELEIFEYLKSIGVSPIQRYRKLGIELDIYIPAEKIAIEYNGLYWHSELLGGKDKFYHLNKTEICEKNGIKLLHVFDDEWNNKQDFLKAKFRYILKKTDTMERVYARKCEIKEIDSKTKSDFLNKYHIQGNDKSNVMLGAFFNNKMVSIITLSSKRIALGSKSVDRQYEISRFASNSEYNVIGILSKFIKRFSETHNPNKIITYVDRRYSNLSNVYSVCGFEYNGVSKPNYFYMKRYVKRLHRFNFAKHKIVKMGGDPTLTEWQNMQLNGYDRIWDCGTLKYSKEF